MAGCRRPSNASNFGRGSNTGNTFKRKHGSLKVENQRHLGVFLSEIDMNASLPAARQFSNQIIGLIRRIHTWSR